jgi:hypothetical protein
VSDRTEQSLQESAIRFLKLRAELQALRELVKATENSEAADVSRRAAVARGLQARMAHPAAVDLLRMQPDRNV